MFGQFPATSSGQNPSFTGTTPTSSGDGSSSATSGPGSSNSAPPVGVSGSRPTPAGRTQKRGKRSQVPRACDTCRLYRSKCDNNPQCAPCVARGVKCTNTGQKPAYTLATATQYIEELLEHIRELEEELAHHRRHDSARTHSPRRIPSPRPDLLNIGSGEPTPYSENAHSDDEATIQEGHNTLRKDLDRMTSPLPFQPHTKIKTDSGATLSSTVPLASDVSTGFGSVPDNPYNGRYLGKNHEDHYFNVYWNSYHSMMPVVNQNEVENEYEKLWNEEDYEQYPHAPRKPSPLLDIIMALCLQYGTNGAIKNSNQPEYRSLDASVEGKDYYDRCYVYIRSNLERPSITTVQCCLLSTVYLLCAGKVTTAYHVLGLTVRMAYTLRIHQEVDDPDLKLGKRQLYRRIWWSIYRLDIRLSIELSLPHAIQVDQISCHYPSAPRDTSSTTINSMELNALRFHVLFTQLHTAARKIHGYMHRTKLQIWSSQHAQLPAIEVIAREFSDRLSLLTSVWTSSVPNILKFPRLNGGTAFSVDCSRISYDYQSPVWLNRQRLFLESNYHMLLLHLHRPFLRHLCPESEQQRQPTFENTPTANKLALATLQHARSLIYLLHQILTETDHFTGWYAAFNCASAATVCIQIYLQYYQQHSNLQPLASQAGGLSFQALRDALFASLQIFKDFAPSHPPSRDAEASITEFLNRLTVPGSGGGGLSPSVHMGSTSRIASPSNSTVNPVDSKTNIVRVISPALGAGVNQGGYSPAPMPTPPPRPQVMVPVPPDPHMPLDWSSPHETMIQPPSQPEQWGSQYPIDPMFTGPGNVPVGIPNDPVWPGQGGFVPQPGYGPPGGNGGHMGMGGPPQSWDHGRSAGGISQQGHGHQGHSQHQIPSDMTHHLRHQPQHPQRRPSMQLRQQQSGHPQHEQHTQHSQQHPHPGAGGMHMGYYGGENR